MRALIGGLLIVALLLAIVAAVTGLLVVLGLVVALGVLNLIYLPRAASRLRIAPIWLALILAPLMVTVGVVFGGLSGAAWGAGIWLAAIGLPRVIARNVLRRTRRRLETTPPPSTIRVIDI